jgi:hypothetical protein
LHSGPHLTRIVLYPSEISQTHFYPNLRKTELWMTLMRQYHIVVNYWFSFLLETDTGRV